MNEENKSTLIRDFGEPPFSVLDARTSRWLQRKREWLELGIASERGRNPKIKTGNGTYEPSEGTYAYVSVFDPVLCELMYRWFCPLGGKVIDPFCGGSVRGVVAGHLGYEYMGIDVREEQIAENVKQAEGTDNISYLCGDSASVLKTLPKESYDMLFTCPPYWNMEVYSELPGDLSNMNLPTFKKRYKKIIKTACELLKIDAYAVVVVGEVRLRQCERKGGFMGLVPYTIQCFIDAGMEYYNEAIYLQRAGSAPMRARAYMKSQKLVRIHQNVLVFKKTEPLKPNHFEELVKEYRKNQEFFKK